MSEDKKIAVDHCSDRQPNVSPTEMNKTEPNLDQPATDVKRFLTPDRQAEFADLLGSVSLPLVRARGCLRLDDPRRAELSRIHDRLNDIWMEGVQ